MSKPDKPYLEGESIENLGRMLMALTQEVWVMRDRMAVTEKLLADHAGIVAEQIDDYVADPAFRAELERMRDTFAAKVLGAPIAATKRSVEDILHRAGYPRSVPD
jgi:hypothetical protein